MDNNNFGIFIMNIRKEKKMTQRQLADKLYITDKAVSKWERGLSFPDISMLMSLAEVLELDVSELLNCKKREKRRYRYTKNSWWKNSRNRKVKKRKTKKENLKNKYFSNNSFITLLF